MTPWSRSDTHVHTIMDQRKTVSATCSITVCMACMHQRMSLCHSPSGGPGPEVALPLGRFVPGMEVSVNVTLRTDGGQSIATVVMFTARDGTCVMTESVMYCHGLFLFFYIQIQS